MSFWKEVSTHIDIIAGGGAVIFGIIKFIDYKMKREYKDNLRQAFDQTLLGLYSSHMTEKIASAILLRRFLSGKTKEGGRKLLYKTETINVISSLLRIEVYGEFQKTLADSLSYTNDLSFYDFQYTNLQNVYLTPKEYFMQSKKTNPKNHKKLAICNTDFFMSDLSYASLNNIDGSNSVFYCANLFNTTFRDSILENADFRNSDLLNARFINVQLNGAKFALASNIPDNIRLKLDEKGIYNENNTNTEYIDKRSEKKIFISCSGNLSPKQSDYLNSLKNKLKQDGIDILKYSRSNYRKSGQIGIIRNEISKCKGIIILGFKHIIINEGIIRPTTTDKKIIHNQWISTPWNNLEAGIASALGLPILLVTDCDVSDGIFDKTINDKSITRIETNEEEDVFDNALKKWIINL